MRSDGRRKIKRTKTNGRVRGGDSLMRYSLMLLVVLRGFCSDEFIKLGCLLFDPGIWKLTTEKNIK